MGYLKERFTVMKSDEGKTVRKNPYFADIYEELLTPFKDKKVVLVEIGIGYGGSLQVWRDFLGSRAMIYGLDNAGELYEEDRIKCYFADQLDRRSL